MENGLYNKESEWFKIQSWKLSFKPEQGGAVDPGPFPVGLAGAGVGGGVPVRLQGAPRPLPHPHHQLTDHVRQGVSRVVPQLDPLNNLGFCENIINYQSFILVNVWSDAMFPFPTPLLATQEDCQKGK